MAERNAFAALTFSLRLALGALLLVHGLSKIFRGTQYWTTWLTNKFAALTWISHDVIVLIAWLVILMELVLGVLLIAGWVTRLSFLLAINYITLLNIGLFIIGDTTVASFNIYVLVAVAGAYVADRGNMWCVD
jgi:uncharacterized membrane protein YphA (DoxX/SURF4 family)